jgi:hypothetical protein
MIAPAAPSGVPAGPPGSVPAAAAPPSDPSSAIAGALPTPARVELAGAMNRARTAQPGQFMLQAVSLKPQAAPTAPAAEVAPPAARELPAVKLRPLSEVAPRTYSVAPGGLGNLAPPKAQADAERAARRRTWLLVGAAVVVAALASVIAALAL